MLELKAENATLKKGNEETKAMNTTLANELLNERNRFEQLEQSIIEANNKNKKQK